jgi:hypothetical protein
MLVLFIVLCKSFPWLNNTRQEIGKNASWLYESRNLHEPYNIKTLELDKHFVSSPRVP